MYVILPLGVRREGGQTRVSASWGPCLGNYAFMVRMCGGFCQRYELSDKASRYFLPVKYEAGVMYQLGSYPLQYKVYRFGYCTYWRKEKAER